MIDFMAIGCQTCPPVTNSRPRGRRWPQWITVYGLKELFQIVILYSLCLGRLHAIPGRNYVYFCGGFSFILKDLCICLGSRVVSYEILSLCIRGFQEHLEIPYEGDWGVPRNCGHDENDRFHAQKPLDNPQWQIQGPRVGADAQWITVHGLKTLFQKAMLYSHQKIYLCQGRFHAIPARNYVYFCDCFSQYLRICELVWALVLFPKRYCPYASVDSSRGI